MEKNITDLDYLRELTGNKRLEFTVSNLNIVKESHSHEIYIHKTGRFMNG